ncbi:LytR/AlgR family response regulator transcription factor [Terriglobus aquaticus]|uniref:LytR/AlgR family response regulator transcription factor n=1 Tax=Terriglobus aquaticus TaxID=940139 RepID=A0ABW9KIX1_9BACT|nr:response regulator [Terriglobus aquaticus]
MGLTAVVVDDEPLARRELHYLLGRIGDVDVVAEASNGIEAVETIRNAAPDVVFLDVQMPGLDGFAVLKKLIDAKALTPEREEPMPEVVFATAFDQYAVRAFEVNAIDYLLKPFEERRVRQAIEKVRARQQASASSNGQTTIETVPQASSEERLESLLKLLELQAGATQAGAATAQAGPARGTRVRSGKVVVRSGQRLLLVEERDVSFASIEEGAISVVTPQMEGLANCRTIEELAEQVDPNSFWRAHRSYLVNIAHIREVVPWFKSTYLLRMDDRKQTEIPVARAQIKRLRELFNL